MKIIIGVFCLLVLFGTSTRCVNAQKEVLSTFCQLSVSEELKRSNVSFTDGFSFKIDQNGKPFGVKKILGKFVKIEEVTSCLDKWRFTGFSENSHVSVYFSWKHGVGWVQMRIISKGFSQLVALGDNYCSEGSGGSPSETS